LDDESDAIRFGSPDFWEVQISGGKVIDPGWQK